MADKAIPTCSWCGEPIERRGRRGPAPTYCSNACRMSAYRARRHVALIADELQPIGVPFESEPSGTSMPKDEEVARAVLEAKILAGTFYRLGREARPQFAWRCITLADALAAALKSTFGED